jgi:transposase
VDYAQREAQGAEPQAKGAGKMDRITRFVGLDTSKDSIAVGIADAGRERGRHWGSIENAPEKVRRLMENLGPKEELLVCYEAGPTGYGLYRQLTRMGIRCIVVAPALIPKRPGDRVKTDRRDAVRLAELLRAGELTAVWVPGEEDEALRDLARMRSPIA